MAHVADRKAPVVTIAGARRDMFRSSQIWFSEQLRNRYRKGAFSLSDLTAPSIFKVGARGGGSLRRQRMLMNVSIAAPVGANELKMESAYVQFLRELAEHFGRSVFAYDKGLPQSGT